MTKDEEDALVNAYWKFAEEWTGRGKEFHDRYKTTGMEFGLACWKAAYAQGNTDGVAAERERCAFICQHRADVCREAIKTDPSPLTRMVLQYQEEQADDCAAAIRKGE